MEVQILDLGINFGNLGNNFGFLIFNFGFSAGAHPDITGYLVQPTSYVTI